MKKQTAVEWLQLQLNENGKLSAVDFYQAKEMEKEQIIDAFDEGNPHAFIPKDGQQYFNETYKQQTP